jgi:hypothetical protein
MLRFEKVFNVQFLNRTPLDGNRGQTADCGSEGASIER